MTITGEVIKKIREILKWTQQQMGDAIESSRELVNKMESKNLPISKARKILIEKLVKDYKLLTIIPNMFPKVFILIKNPKQIL